MHNQIYDLQRRCVEDTDSFLALKKGVYIVNGQKVVIR